MPDVVLLDFSGPRLAWFRAKLLESSGKRPREFPWRQTTDAFHVLIAEVLLRRTWARQVQPVYEALIARYPTTSHLAQADVSEVRRLTSSLGLPTRAEQLLEIARLLDQRFGGRVPQDRQSLKTLPGVGDYVAGAVLSVAFDQPEWIVDTNVVRVLRRYLALPAQGDIRRSPVILNAAAAFARCKSPRRANLALLDHASLVCVPKAPKCGECPVRNHCRSAVTPRAIAASPDAPNFARHLKAEGLGPARVRA